MLELKFVRQNLDKVKDSLEKRFTEADLATFSKCDEERRSILLKIEDLRHRRNVVSDEIKELKKAGEDAEKLIGEMREVSSDIKGMDGSLSKLEETINDIIIGIPNIPHPSVPSGKTEDDNDLLKEVGDVPTFSFEPKAHWDIGEDLKIFNFEKASQITGARFPLYLGLGARLERALISFMLDIHTEEHGYTEVLPPYIVNRKSMTGTGQLPKFEEDLFKIEGWDYFLIPTAEVPVTNIHAGDILTEDELPINYTAFTPCFRSEAGSYGRDTRGLIRQHQFHKVELVKFTKAEESYDELEKLLSNAETILKRLGIAYRVVTLCGGDLGFSAAKTYDIEVWMPAQNVYREISSCSNFEDFQARRAGLRFKRKGQKGTELVHTLNGSGLAVGRTVAAILENFQQEDGTVLIPEALQPYMGGLKRIE
ncbi:MAG: serine--tRNA ligase [Desulfobacterales bacterium]|nr:serine--tRNA ligase [Desulfobacterales bacterium]MCP4162259.1 serine--tRNA ligase [Deltaproteobacteria bacterium]